VDLQHEYQVAVREPAFGHVVTLANGSANCVSVRPENRRVARTVALANETSYAPSYRHQTNTANAARVGIHVLHARGFGSSDGG
jgi:hypothetical protein